MWVQSDIACIKNATLEKGRRGKKTYNMSVLIDKIKQFKWVPTSREDLACAEDALLANIHGQFYQHTVRTPQCEVNTSSSVAPGAPSE